ncbi:MAG TPA: hypothetical protein PLO69_09800 [Gammaproteobacteria bacterium]|nr:hypothetical protein [Gammaproteobacteria bacterium]
MGRYNPNYTENINESNMCARRLRGIVTVLVLLFVAGCAGQAPSIKPQTLGPPTDVYLLPIGDFPYKYTVQLAHELSKELKIHVRASLPMGIGDMHPLPNQSQLAVRDILARAHEVGLRLPDTSKKLVVIALTTRDINDSSQSLRFLFARNDRITRTSVISIARMFGSTTLAKSTRAQVGLRIYKMVKRAIGEQYFGLARTSDISEIMYAPIMSLKDIDAMGLDYKRSQSAGAAPPEFPSETRELESAARAGDAMAQYSLGLDYYNGTGVPQDAARAIHWWKMAAAQGFPEAQYSLGIEYEMGRGVPRDYSKAVYWWRKAATQGVVRAQYNLGVAYHEGLGVPKDYEKANYWYRKAATQGFDQAQFSLGADYHDGLGVPQDFGKAAHWSKQAAEQGFARAQFNLALMYYNGQGVRQDFGKAAHWNQQAAAQGLAAAQYYLAVMYYRGQGVPQDYGKAAHWCQQAAAQGLAAAQYYLAVMYYKGQGVPQDYGKAVDLLKRAASQGLAAAQDSLAVTYYKGAGVAQNRARALYWWRKAAAQGDLRAQRAIRLLKNGTLLNH